jgi:succinate dehydrogenase / fumarate reductase cytochrome b subunit
VLALFVIYHILHMTTGTLHPLFSHSDVYTNMVLGLRVPWVAAIYLVAVAALGLHLYHGMWSVFQSLGFASPGISPVRRRLATGIAIFVYIGFTAIPLAILFRFLDLR